MSVLRFNSQINPGCVEGCVTSISFTGEFLDSYTHQVINPPNERTRIGISLALGSLPPSMLTGHLDKVLSALVQAATNVTSRDDSWAEARRDAFKAIDR